MEGTKRMRGVRIRERLSLSCKTKLVMNLSSFLSVSGRRKREVNKSLWLKIEFYVKGEVLHDTRRGQIALAQVAQHHLFSFFFTPLTFSFSSILARYAFLLVAFMF